MEHRSAKSSQTTKGSYDVVICGGGIAALVMARQLQLYQPELSILILDSARVPSPISCHKVGESIPEGASYHLRHTLALNDYLFSKHVPKLGFRFFFGGGGMPLSKRLEYGGVQWPPFATFQLDRGILENDLRQMVIEKGATVLSEVKVNDFELSGVKPHRVYATGNREELVFSASWIIDASGRRRLLASKLGLKRAIDHCVGATWWRVEGRVDVAALVDAEQIDWHRRVGPPRWHSTVHMVGEGYWMWIIPLISGATSIGIVADENTHPIRERATYELCLEWCRKHEPEIAKLIAGRPALDFHALKNFAHSTSQAFSDQRWSCIGDAAVLTDPLYGLGQDLIGHAVSITAKLIELDRRGLLTEQIASDYNKMFLMMFEIIMDQYRGAYGTFGSPFLYTQKLAWDSSMYFGILQQLLMQNIYDNVTAVPGVLETLERLAVVNRAMQRLFIDHFKEHGRQDILEGMRTWSPRVAVFADSSLDKCLPDQLREFFRERLKHLEGIAVALFAELIRNNSAIPASQVNLFLSSSVGVNPAALTIDPKSWDLKSLFDPSYAKPNFDVPPQFDVQNRIEAEQRDYRAVHLQFCASAVQNLNRIAIVENNTRLTYAGILDRVQRLASGLRKYSGKYVGIPRSGLSASLEALLAVLAAGKAFVLFEHDWTNDQRDRVTEHCKPELMLTEELACELVRAADGNACEPQWENALPEDSRMETAFTEFRFSEFGLRAVDLSHVAYFRMCRWLPLLMRKGLGEGTSLADLCCLWSGPVSPEMVVLLLHGSTLVVTGSDDGFALLDLIEEHKVDIMLGRPHVFQSLVDAGWPGRGLRVVSVYDPLPRNLSLTLRSRAQRVCDFGYATFAH